MHGRAALVRVVRARRALRGRSRMRDADGAVRAPASPSERCSRELGQRRGNAGAPTAARAKARRSASRLSVCFGRRRGLHGERSERALGSLTQRQISLFLSRRLRSQPRLCLVRKRVLAPRQLLLEVLARGARREIAAGGRGRRARRRRALLVPAARERKHRAAVTDRAERAASVHAAPIGTEEPELIGRHVQ